MDKEIPCNSIRSSLGEVLPESQPDALTTGSLQVLTAKAVFETSLSVRHQIIVDLISLIRTHICTPELT